MKFMEICPNIYLPRSASISSYQDPPQFHCPPSLRGGLLPALFSLSARFWFRLCPFSSNRRQTPTTAFAGCSPSPPLQGRPPPILGTVLPWGSRSLAVPGEQCLQPSCLVRASVLLHLGWG